MNMHPVPREFSAPPQNTNVGGAVEPFSGGPRGSDDLQGQTLRAMLFQVLGLAIKHRRLICLFALAGVLGGLVTTILTPRVYSASTVVKIDRSAPKVGTIQQSALDGLGDPQFYQTQYELIRSRSLAHRVATNLNLAQSTFLEGGKASIWSSRGVSEPEAERDPATILARQRASVGVIMAGLTVQPVAASSLVRIRFSSTSPEWAQRISVAIAENYERSTLDRRFGASQHARNFLDERLQQLKIKLQDSEKQLIAYAQREGIVEIDDKKQSLNPTLAGLQAALSTAVTERVKAEQFWLPVQTIDGLELPQILNDKVIQSARERLALLNATYQDKLNILKPAFPEMVALRAQMVETERQIRSQIALVKDSIRVQFETARSQEDALREKLDEVKADVLDARGRSVEFTILAREVDTARTLYDGLLQQFREVGIAGDVDTNNISIIDRAERPGVHDSPSLVKNLFLGLLLSMLGAAATITVREALDDTFKSPEDLEESLGVSVLGVTPLFSSVGGRTPLMEVREDATSALAESFRLLRTALQFSTSDGAPKSLMVTSSRPGEGKSTTAVCLAVNFAQLGMRVLLIDADLRNPSIHKVLAIDNSAGLSNFLAGSTDSSKLTQACGIDGVTVLPTGPLPPNPAELLAGPRFASLLATATETFDLVIVDGPPVMGLADAPIISSVVAGTLLVVEAGGTRRAIVRDALRRLQFARARIVGSVLNKFDPASSGHTYGYSYGYAYGGHSYYAYGPETKPALTEK
jgi:capsular exopolysaccharide synthesis family protein